MLDASLFYLLGGIVLVGVIALLYTRFYKERDTGGTDELNWVNKSNHPISLRFRVTAGAFVTSL